MDSQHDNPGGKAGSNGNGAAMALRAVAEAVARLRYGAIELTVHDGRVVQLDVTERRRFT